MDAFCSRVTVGLIAALLSGAGVVAGWADSPSITCINEHSVRVKACPSGKGSYSAFNECYKSSIATFRECVANSKTPPAAQTGAADKVIESSIASLGRPELLDQRESTILSASGMKGIDALIGTRAVVSSLALTDAQKLMTILGTDASKAKALRDMVRAASIIEQLSLRYRKDVADGQLTEERQKFYEQWIGELYNTIDHRLHMDFAVEVYSKPDHRDGSVRAKQKLHALKDRVTPATKPDIYRLDNLIKSSDSYFKNLSLDPPDSSTKLKWERRDQ